MVRAHAVEQCVAYVCADGTRQVALSRARCILGSPSSPSSHEPRVPSLHLLCSANGIYYFIDMIELLSIFEILPYKPAAVKKIRYRVWTLKVSIVYWLVCVCVCVCVCVLFIGLFIIYIYIDILFIGYDPLPRLDPQGLAPHTLEPST